MKEMTKLLTSYKNRVQLLHEKSSFMEAKLTEIRIEHEVALRRATLAESELVKTKQKHLLYDHDMN
jgi:hypothetical protein